MGVSPIAIALVVVMTAVIGAACGESKQAETTSVPGSSVSITVGDVPTTVASSVDRCARAGRIVADYNILAPGASRRGYLILLHELQRDCPTEALNRGLDS